MTWQLYVFIVVCAVAAAYGVLLGLSFTGDVQAECDCGKGEACSAAPCCGTPLTAAVSPLEPVDRYEGPLRVEKASKERVVFHVPHCHAFVDGECDKDCLLDDAELHAQFRERVKEARKALLADDDETMLRYLRTGRAELESGAPE